MITITFPETDKINIPDRHITSLTSPVGAGNSISNTNDLPGVATFVKSQFPQFVSEDHPAFIEFMEVYYSWLDSKGKPLHEARTILQNQDIDFVDEEHEEHLFNEFLSILPRDFVADRSLVLKNIKQFYGAKGTEKSFKFLFRALFNADSYLYYPKVDILKTSDGKWIQNKTVRLTNIVGDIKKIRAQKIRGVDTNTIAFVERFYGTNFTGVDAYELVLNSASITGSFEPNELVVCSYSDGDETITITGNVSPLLASVKITKRGRGYKLGDTLHIVDPFGQDGVIMVSAVDDDGGILSCNIKEYGIGYNANKPPTQLRFINDDHPEFLSGTAENNPDVALVNLVLGSTTNYPGYFRNSDGQPSANKYIHDGYFYQQFSYVTYTDRSYDEYKDVMNKVVHPVGFKHFGGITVNNYGNVQVNTEEYTSIKRPQTVSVYARLKTKATNVIFHQFCKTPNALGPSYESILRDKFSYKPFIKYDANREILSPDLYYGSGAVGKKASTPVANFINIKDLSLRSVDFYENKNGTVIPMELKPKDVEHNRIHKIRYLPDSCIIQNPNRLVVSTLHESPTHKNVVSGQIGETKTISFTVINYTDGVFTWSVRKNGITVEVGTSNQESHEISINIPVEPCRICLYAVDNLGREYKSDEVRIKVVS